MKMNLSSRIALGLLLLSLAACGGGGGSSEPKVATALSYTLPPASSGWHLIRNTTLSSPTHLVLDLVGPVSESGYGVTLELLADNTKLTWTKVQSSDPELIRNLRFDLGNGKPILRATAKGNLLMAAVFQKGVKGIPTPFAGPLASVALDLKPGQPTGSEIQIGVQLAQQLQSSGMAPISLAIGKIVAE